MDNYEIRLVLLAQHYRAMFTTNECGSLPSDPRLKGIADPIINANIGYLIDKGLLGGTKIYMGSRMVPILSDISARGIDVVEEIMDESLAKLETDEAGKIRGEQDTSTKFNKFYDLCIRATPVCETVVNVARSVFVSCL